MGFWDNIKAAIAETPLTIPMPSGATMLVPPKKKVYRDQDYWEGAWADMESRAIGGDDKLGATDTSKLFAYRKGNDGSLSLQAGQSFNNYDDFKLGETLYNQFMSSNFPPAFNAPNGIVAAPDPNVFANDLMEQGEKKKWVAFKTYLDHLEFGSEPPKSISPSTLLGDIAPKPFADFIHQWDKFKKNTLTPAIKNAFIFDTPAPSAFSPTLRLKFSLSEGAAGRIANTITGGVFNPLNVWATPAENIVQFGLGAEKMSLVGPVVERLTGTDLRDLTGSAEGEAGRMAYILGAATSLAAVHGAGAAIGAEATAGTVMLRNAATPGSVASKFLDTVLKYNIPREAVIGTTDYTAFVAPHCDSIFDIMHEAVIGGAWGAVLPVGFAAGGAAVSGLAQKVYTALGKTELLGLARGSSIAAEYGLGADDVKTLLSKLDEPDVRALLGISKSKQAGQLLSDLGFAKLVTKPKQAFLKTTAAVKPLRVVRDVVTETYDILSKAVDGFASIGVPAEVRNALRLGTGMTEAARKGMTEQANAALLSARDSLPSVAEKQAVNDYINLRNYVYRAKEVKAGRANFYIEPDTVAEVTMRSGEQKLGGIVKGMKQDSIVDIMAGAGEGSLQSIYAKMSPAQKEAVKAYDLFIEGHRLSLKHLGANIYRQEGYVPGVFELIDDTREFLIKNPMMGVGLAKIPVEELPDFVNKMDLDMIGKQVDNLYQQKGIFKESLSDPFLAAQVRLELTSQSIYRDAFYRYAAKTTSVISTSQTPSGELKVTFQPNLFDRETRMKIRSAVKHKLTGETYRDVYGGKYTLMVDNPSTVTAEYVGGRQEFLSKKGDYQGLARTLAMQHGADAVTGQEAEVMASVMRRYHLTPTNYSELKYNPTTGAVDVTVDFANPQMIREATVGNANRTYLVPKGVADSWMASSYRVKSETMRNINAAVQGWKRFVLMLSEPAFGIRNLTSDLVSVANLQPEATLKLDDAAWALMARSRYNRLIEKAGGVNKAINKGVEGDAEFIKNFQTAVAAADMEFANLGRMTQSVFVKRYNNLKTELRETLGNTFTDRELNAIIGLQIAEHQGVMTSMGLTETAAFAGLPERIKRRVSDFRDEATQASAGFMQGVAKPSQWWAHLSGARENAPRLAAELSQIEKIISGEGAVTKNFVEAGLDKYPLWSASKGVRIVQVDYNSQDPRYRKIVGQGLAPFYVWYAQTARNMARTMTNPITASQAAAKFFLPMSAMAAWNEQTGVKVPDWIGAMPHIVTGWYDEDTGDPIIYSFNTVIDSAAEMFGCEPIIRNLGNLAEGKVSPSEVIEECIRTLQGKEGWNKQPLTKMARELSNPLAQGIYGLITNTDTFSGAQIVHQNYDADGNPMVLDTMGQQANYLVGKLVSPYNYFLGMQRRGEVAEPDSVAEGIGQIINAQVGKMADMQKAFGGRPIDQGAVFNSVKYETSRKYQAITDKERGDLQDAYIKMQVNDTESSRKAYMTEFLKWQDKAIAAGYKPEAFYDYIGTLTDKSAWVSREIIIKKLGIANSKGDKALAQALLREKEKWDWVLADTTLERIPNLNEGLARTEAARIGGLQ